MTTATESASLISSGLLRQVNDLLTGSRIESISTDAELAASVDLLKIVKRTAADLETERKAAVDPLNAKLKEINGEYKDKLSALDGLARNLSNKGGEYQLEQRRIADEKRRKAEEAAEAERRRLAEIESKRLEEEERLRRDAEAKLTQAEQATNPEERAAIIEEANTASAVADMAAQEAMDAARAGAEVVAAKVESHVYKPQGFGASVDYTAKVTDHRAAMRWIVENNEWGAIENKAFTDCINAAMTKIAKLKKDAFKVPGCILEKQAKGRVRY